MRYRIGVPRFVVAFSVLASTAFACTHPEPSAFRPPVIATRADVTSVRPTVAQLGRDANAPDIRAQVGLATWYGAELAGHKTSNGEVFDPRKMTAAHRKLPFGTWVEVRRIDTGRTVRVRINDRGPWGDDRTIIDLSRRAAELLDIMSAGRAKVEIRVVSGPN
jgi:rare lipoprotein A (peptidoglycan hydrolase)